jgi:hypothetical protein
MNMEGNLISPSMKGLQDGSKAFLIILLVFLFFVLCYSFLFLGITGNWI